MDAFFLSGASGTGKTTIALLIAAEVASEWAIEELDASDLTPAKLREVERRTSGRCVDGGGHAIVINEVHGLRKDTIRQLLVTLERIPPHVVWLFTTTSEQADNLFEECLDSNPLLSRCVELPLARRGLADAFAQRAREIAQTEGLDGQPLEKYLRLVKDKRNNLRRVLQDIGSGLMLED